jgi:hypothetical protein
MCGLSQARLEATLIRKSMQLQEIEISRHAFLLSSIGVSLRDDVPSLFQQRSRSKSIVIWYTVYIVKRYIVDIETHLSSAMVLLRSASRRRAFQKQRRDDNGSSLT